VPVIICSAVELAVTGLTEVEGPPTVQLLAVSVMTYLWVKDGRWVKLDLTNRRTCCLDHCQALMGLPLVIQPSSPVGCLMLGFIHLDNLS
jgi:hypothetical protein